jgi:putative oxidoreductase
MIKRLFSGFNSRFVQVKDYGAIFIRIAFGFHLIRASYCELFDFAAQKEFATFLASIGVPFPLIGAYLCHITEFFGGVALIAGFLVRPFAIPLIVTFAVAWFVAQWGKPYKEQFQAIQMLAVSLFFLFHGAGRLSLDNFFFSRRAGEFRQPSPS